TTNKNGNSTLEHSKEHIHRPTSFNKNNISLTLSELEKSADVINFPARHGERVVILTTSWDMRPDQVDSSLHTHTARPVQTSTRLLE
ncbi:hypothetical protein BgiMline_009101, partial [Biomphalaria glabrata]